MASTVGPAKWSIHSLCETVARNGLAGIAVNTDSLLPRSTGDNLVFNQAGVIRQVALTTAAIANCDQWRMRYPSENLYKQFVERLGIRDQTDEVDRQKILDIIMPVAPNSIINVDADNTNNAQYETAMLAVDYGAGQCLMHTPPILDREVYYFEATGTTTLVAGNWTLCTLTWPALKAGDKYQIIGLVAHSATGTLARLVFPDTSYRPGIPAADTGDERVVLWGNFGSFEALNEPNAEFLATAGDTAQGITAVCVKI